MIDLKTKSTRDVRNLFVYVATSCTNFRPDEGKKSFYFIQYSKHYTKISANAICNEGNEEEILFPDGNVSLFP
jgi:hypothetical protein